MNFTTFLAQAGPPEWWSLLAGTGVAGVVLAWFMLRAESKFERVEKRLIANENANNRTTRAILLLVMSLRQATETAKSEADAIKDEIEDSERKRKEEVEKE